MFTLSEAAVLLGLKSNKLRYWLKKNCIEVEKELYDFSLTDLLQRLFRHKNGRKYKCFFILDFDEFRDEYEKYMEHVLSSKHKKRVGNFSWTQSAIDCFNCNMECKKCFNSEICLKFSSADSEPPMKNTVKKLLNILGKPPKE